MKKTGIVFVGNRFVSLKRAHIPVTDLAVQRGIGLFESLRTYDQKPFALEQRSKRLLSSARALGLKLEKKISIGFLDRIVNLGIRKAGFGETLVKIIITGGDGNGLQIAEPSRLIVLFQPLHLWPQKFYEKGIRLKTVRIARAFTHIKSLSYLIPVLADAEAKKSKFDEALFVDEKNNLFEGTQFNFAIIKKQKIITPEKNVLPGITMEIVSSLTKKIGLEFERREISARELRGADEAFITSATREVIPVVQIDRITIADGKPGRFTGILLKKYRENARNQTAKAKK